jgi:hypothetical protein
MDKEVVNIRKYLKEDYNFQHVTIQIETMEESQMLLCEDNM